MQKRIEGTGWLGVVESRNGRATVICGTEGFRNGGDVDGTGIDLTFILEMSFLSQFRYASQALALALAQQRTTATPSRLIDATAVDPRTPPTYTRPTPSRPLPLIRRMMLHHHRPLRNIHPLIRIQLPLRRTQHQSLIQHHCPCPCPCPNQHAKKPSATA